MGQGPGQPGVKPDFLKDSLDDGAKLPSALDKGVVLPSTDGGVTTETVPSADPGSASADSPAPETTPSEPESK